MLLGGQEHLTHTHHLLLHCAPTKGTPPPPPTRRREYITALFDDALAFGDVLADGGGDAHGDHAKVGDGVHYVVGLRERGEEMNRGWGRKKGVDT